MSNCNKCNNVSGTEPEKTCATQTCVSTNKGECLFNCLTCNKGKGLVKFKNSNNRYTCSDCEKDQYLSAEGLCKTCEQIKNCSDSTCTPNGMICNSCEPLYTRTSTFKKCNKQDSFCNNYLTNCNVCTEPADNDSKGSCQGCTNGYTCEKKNPTDHNCVSCTCVGKNYKNKNKQCLPCKPPTNCNDKWSCNSNGVSKCTECNKGYQLKDGVCSLCSSEKYLDATTSLCSPCKKINYCKQLKCNDNTKSTCVTCNDGFINTGSTCECNDGTHSDTGNCKSSLPEPSSPSPLPSSPSPSPSSKSNIVAKIGITLLIILILIALGFLIKEIIIKD